MGKRPGEHTKASCQTAQCGGTAAHLSVHRTRMWRVQAPSVISWAFREIFITLPSWKLEAESQGRCTRTVWGWTSQPQSHVGEKNARTVKRCFGHRHTFSHIYSWKNRVGKILHPFHVKVISLWLCLKGAVSASAIRWRKWAVLIQFISCYNQDPEVCWALKPALLKFLNLRLHEKPFTSHRNEWASRGSCVSLSWGITEIDYKRKLGFPNQFWVE